MTSAMKSAGSVASLGSVGMGEQAATSAGNHHPVSARPVPEGVLNTTEPVYDCIVYLIFCPTHENIALSSRSKSQSVWLPFVGLSDGETWIKASHDGVEVLIGRNDPEMEAEEAERQAPIYRLNYLQVLRLQLPGSKRAVLRLSQLIYLEGNAHFQCCKDTDRVSWLPVADVLATAGHHPAASSSQLRQLWGPEVRTLTTLVSSGAPQNQVLEECTLASGALHYLKLAGSRQQEVLLSVRLLTEATVLEIYGDYIEHCYPSLYMALQSFRLYLLRFGVTLEEAPLQRLFAAFCLTDDSEQGRDYLDFHQLLISLAVFDPSCPSNLALRQRFIFKYYDTENKGRLEVNNVALMLADAFPAWPPQKVKEEARLIMANRQQLAFEDFVACFREQLNNPGSPLNERLCRTPKSIQLAQITSQLASRRQDRLQSAAVCQEGMKAKRTTRGTCWSCRAQQYEYGNHCVTIDTVGRCVEPNIIAAIVPPPASSPFSISRSRYSLEYVFAIASSVPNIFIDLVRDFHAKRSSAASAPLAVSKQPSGLMTAPQEWHIFYKYLRVLCNDLSSMLTTEKKLIKINAPAVVVGDLHGSLADLLHLEALFWQSFPVISESLVFLGNYSGKFSFGLECLIYLFSLKLCLPNKVYLLRGAAELGSVDSVVHGRALLQECTTKFGAEHGKLVVAVLVEIFAKLPLAVVVDETILCTHSGIPATAVATTAATPRLEPVLLKLPVEMPTLPRDSPLAHSIIMRYPKGDQAEQGVALNSLAAAQSPKSFKSGKYKSAKVEPVCPKLPQGGKAIGDTRLQPDFKSFPSKKQLPKSATKTKTRSFSKGTKWQSHQGKSLGAKSKQGNKSNKSPVMPATQFSISKAGQMGKRKMVFLKSRYKVPQKTAMTTAKSPAKVRSIQQKTKKQQQPKSASSGRGREAFDQNEFLDFMKTNDFSFFIRSGSVCRTGYRIKFGRQCLTVFSCSNLNRANEAAVVLIEGTACSIRFIRYQHKQQ